jgi:hypothetical protein
MLVESRKPVLWCDGVWRYEWIGQPVPRTKNDLVEILDGGSTLKFNRSSIVGRNSLNWRLGDDSVKCKRSI